MDGLLSSAKKVGDHGLCFIGGILRAPCKHSLAIYIKTYLKAKEELWKFKYFTMQKYTKSSKKKSSKKKSESFEISS
jgi:hypothetical protein